MAGVSSLLKSAASRRQKIQDQNDAFAAYEWDNSAQTYQDFVQYSKYLSNQAKNVSDPSKLLSYQTKIRSAQRSYTSNEIQRQTQSVTEGRGTIDDKMNTVRGLYQRAVANGDMNLAQNLISTWDSLSVQKQNQEQAAVSAGKAAASQRASDAKTFVSDITKTISQVSSIFSKNGGEKFKKLNGGVDYFDQLLSIGEAGRQQLLDAINSEADPKTKNDLSQIYNDYITKASFDLPGANGKPLKVSLSDISNEAKAAQTGQTIFNPVAGSNGTFFTQNQQTGVAYGRNAQGKYDLLPLYNAAVPNTTVQKLDASGNPILDKYGRPEYYTAQELLQKNNFQTAGGTQGSDSGVLSIYNTGNIPGFYGSPFPTGTNAQVTVGPNGELQIANGDQVYNLNFDKNGNFTGLSQYLPNAVTQFNGSTAQYNRPFYSGMDLSNNTPDLNSLVGLVDLPLAENYLTRAGSLNLSQPSNLLRTANTVLQSNVAAKALQNAPNVVQHTAPSPQRTAPATRLQNAANPFFLPQVKALKVAKPIPQPKVKVAAPAPTPRISSVGVAPSNVRISF